MTHKTDCCKGTGRKIVNHKGAACGYEYEICHCPEGKKSLDKKASDIANSNKEGRGGINGI